MPALPPASLAIAATISHLVDSDRQGLHEVRRVEADAPTS